MMEKSITLEMHGKRITVEPEPFARTGGSFIRRVGFDSGSGRYTPEPLSLYLPTEKYDDYYGPESKLSTLNTGAKCGITYAELLKLAETGYEILTPVELSYLKAQHTLGNIWNYEWHINGGGSIGAPYWTLWGMGWLHDLMGNYPQEFRGRFLLAKIKDVASDNSALPDFEDAIILSDRELKHMHGYVRDWDARTRTGLAVPFCGGNSTELGKINLEGILSRRFSPIVVGEKEGWSNANYGNPDNRRTNYDLIITSSNLERCLGVWTRKVGEGIPKRIYNCVKEF